MQAPKHTHSARSFADYAFGGSRLDAMQMPEPRISGSVCGITSLLAPRGVLFEEDRGAGGGGGGDEKKFSQADLDRLITDRLKREQAKYADYDQIKAQVAELAKKNAESEATAQQMREEAELKGKSELEKSQHQLKKQEELRQKEASDWQRKFAEAENSAKAWQTRFVDKEKHTAVSGALLSAGVNPKFADDATYLFLREAQIDFDENYAIKSMTVGGKPFEKIEEAGKHFLSLKPNYAPPAQGGSGGPRSALGGAGGSVDSINTLTGLLSAGMQQHAAGKSG